MKPIVAAGLMTGVIFLAASAWALEDVQIQAGGERMKASIPSVAEGPAAPSVNWVYEGVGLAARGTYYVAKTAVDAWGTATDWTVASVQHATGRAFQTARKPFHKKENEKK